MIRFSFKNLFDTTSINIILLKNEYIIINTCKLLNDIYFGTTIQKKYESKIIIKEFQYDLIKFAVLVGDYINENNTKIKDEFLSGIREELSNKSAYTAFKRWYLIDNFSKNDTLMLLVLNSRL